jgi:hypothetical protein
MNRNTVTIVVRMIIAASSNLVATDDESEHRPQRDQAENEEAREPEAKIHSTPRESRNTSTLKDDSIFQRVRVAPR